MAHVPIELLLIFFVYDSEVLANGEFHSFLISRNILLFGIDINSEEGVRVSYILRESVYPFLALIMLRGSRMTVVGRFEGNCFTFAVQVSHHALLFTFDCLRLFHL